ncbi:hypothetical protein FE257_010331 [Aspergillus nanangensis]|uniref:GDSL lipase/acylhydrolase family protein n=1 Tax=Aspergillus nanangensis TaxID=2582783 RepID=A0AAD4GS83_ASPNN|nr:hypothetical protein FE257_010331 [Aspergillus nanangensis]
MYRLQLLPSLVALGLAVICAQAHHHWGPPRFESLVTFGDSYTDDSRLNYFISHNNSAPPVGWVQPENPNSATGGYTWGHFVAQSAKVIRYNYAVSGASCSHQITSRWNPLTNAPFPSVLEYQIPAFLADSHHTSPDGDPFLNIPSPSTVYAIWVGTNDLGIYAFLTDSQVPGKTIPDYIDCVFNALDPVYRNGGRYFVIMNNAPAQLAPMYANKHSVFWPDKPENDTLERYRMWEQVVLVNEVMEYRTAVEARVKARYPGAEFAVMDIYGLLSDIYHHPGEYFHSQAPANVTGYIHHCDAGGQNCIRLENEDSFMWFDESHPSQRTEQIIAEEFVGVVRGESKWASYW